MTKFERMNNAFTSPVVFYGMTTSTFLCDGLQRDSHGKAVVNEKGQMSSIKSLISKEHPCPCHSRDEAIAKLREMYDKATSLYHQHQYAPFERCIRDVEPVNPRIHPELHGVRLVMYPIS